MLFNRDMNTIENVKPGQTFKCLGVEYKMLRFAGEVQMPNRNQWGRSEGGHHTALKVAVKVNRHHKGWRFSYVGFRPGTYVTIED